MWRYRQGEGAYDGKMLLTNSRFLRGAPCSDSSNKVSDAPGCCAFISADRESTLSLSEHGESRPRVPSESHARIDITVGYCVFD